ncbi:hypothetical protein MVG78_10785 [Roseomonas gilardii subsp. gilardii]|uniref:hypothetical protein n=1 Tax=Roseomonas gilardii TaxID=257708 RepID=UPI001FF990DF|nr:hypothetical protein [Roseomonas gilardii]UPG71099.1 hypothetical protein MVG78_10785 [Roseomonas gilardii subsp. gilardii]
MTRIAMALLAASLAGPAMIGSASAQTGTQSGPQGTAPSASGRAQQQLNQEFRREQENNIINRQPSTGSPQNRAGATTRADAVEAERAPDLNQLGAPGDNIRGGAHLQRPPGTGPQAGEPEATPLLQQRLR